MMKGDFGSLKFQLYYHLKGLPFMRLSN